MQQIKRALGMVLPAAWLLAACGNPNPPSTGTSPGPAATLPPLATDASVEGATADRGQAMVSSGSCAELYSPETLARRSIGVRQRFVIQTAI